MGCTQSKEKAGARFVLDSAIAADLQTGLSRAVLSPCRSPSSTPRHRSPLRVLPQQSHARSAHASAAAAVPSMTNAELVATFCRLTTQQISATPASTRNNKNPARGTPLHPQHDVDDDASPASPANSTGVYASPASMTPGNPHAPRDGAAGVARGAAVGPASVSASTSAVVFSEEIAAARDTADALPHPRPLNAARPPLQRIG